MHLPSEDGILRRHREVWSGSPHWGHHLPLETGVRWVEILPQPMLPV